MVTCHLHLTWPCYAALGRVLICEIHGRIQTWDLSICLYLNLKHGYLDHSATTASSETILLLSKFSLLNRVTLRLINFAFMSLSRVLLCFWTNTINLIILCKNKFCSLWLVFSPVLLEKSYCCVHVIKLTRQVQNLFQDLWNKFLGFFSSIQKVFIVNPHSQKTYNGQTFQVIVTML